MSTLKNLSAETKEIQAQIRKLAQEKVTPALQAAFTELKAQFPNLEAIRWKQYTPYFNDGDECVFGLHGVYFRLEGFPSDGGDYSDGFESPWGFKYHKFLTEDQSKILSSFESDLSGLKPLLKEALGDHAEVTLTVNGIEVEEYEHD